MVGAINIFGYNLSLLEPRFPAPTKPMMSEPTDDSFGVNVAFIDWFTIIMMMLLLPNRFGAVSAAQSQSGVFVL